VASLLVAVNKLIVLSGLAVVSGLAPRRAAQQPQNQALRFT